MYGTAESCVASVSHSMSVRMQVLQIGTCCLLEIDACTFDACTMNKTITNLIWIVSSGQFESDFKTVDALQLAHAHWECEVQ